MEATHHGCGGPQRPSAPPAGVLPAGPAGLGTVAAVLPSLIAAARPSREVPYGDLLSGAAPRPVPATSNARGGRDALAALLPRPRAHRRRSRRRGRRPPGLLGARPRIRGPRTRRAGEGGVRTAGDARPPGHRRSRRAPRRRAAQRLVVGGRRLLRRRHRPRRRARPATRAPDSGDVGHGPRPAPGRVHPAAARGAPGRPRPAHVRVGRRPSRAPRHAGAGPADLLLDLRDVRELDGLRGLARDR